MVDKKALPTLSSLRLEPVVICLLLQKKHQNS
jgi:hypothetical protein